MVIYESVRQAGNGPFPEASEGTNPADSLILNSEVSRMVTE